MKVNTTRPVGRDDGFCAGATIRARAAGIPVTLMAAYVTMPRAGAQR